MLLARPKSRLVNPGPVRTFLPSVPNWNVPGNKPAAGTAKAHGLNQLCGTRTCVGPLQPGFPGNVPAWNGLPTKSGRAGLPKAAADAAGAPASTTVKGEPVCAVTIPLACQLSSSFVLQPGPCVPKRCSGRS